MTDLEICKCGLIDSETQFIETTVDAAEVEIQFNADRCSIREITPIDADVKLVATSLEIRFTPGTAKRFEIRFAESGKFISIRRISE